MDRVEGLERVRNHFRHFYFQGSGGRHPPVIERYSLSDAVAAALHCSRIAVLVGRPSRTAFFVPPNSSGNPNNLVEPFADLHEQSL